MKILFTSVGRRVELIQAFRNAANELGLDLLIYGTDLTSDAPALFFCDRVYSVCRIDACNYIPQLLKICAEEKIDALIPTIDTDLLVLSQNKNEFLQIGTRVVVSNEKEIRICRDKRLTANFFLECGLNTPMPEDKVANYNGGYPCFIKPLNGSSSINAYKVNSYEELIEKTHFVKNYIIQPYIEGREYTIDAFCSFDGSPLLVTPRERISIRSGEVLKTKIYQDSKMISESIAVLDGLKPCGPVTIQLIRDKRTGDDFFIEINPRFGGGSPLSIKAGADSPKMLFRLLQGKALQYQSKIANDNTEYSRYDQSICVDSTAKEIKAVIFDLDDTLYSEKEYVMSGFNAVECLYPTIKAKVLWTKFQLGEPAFDCYKNKKELIDAYRSHLPSIHLYPDIEYLLKTLRKNNIKTGIITDGRPLGQRNKIKMLGLGDLVDYIIVTDEIGIEFRKPSDISFRMMQQKFHIPFEQMAYVFDNIHKDSIAPTKLGIQSIWFDNPDGLYYSGNGNCQNAHDLVKQIIASCGFDCNNMTVPTSLCVCGGRTRFLKQVSIENRIFNSLDGDAA